MSEDVVSDILGKSLRVLSEYPLCDSCLGRLFAKRGLGLRNEQRGFAIKVLLSMKLHDEYLRKGDAPLLEKLAQNAGGPLASLYERLTSKDIEARACYICGNKLNEGLLRAIASEVSELLGELNASTFLIGVKLDQRVMKRELEVALLTGLEASESLKNEVKREVGKLVQSISGRSPDFANPDAVIVVQLDEEFRYRLTPQVNPIILKGYYMKFGRNIPHVPWITREGMRKYPLSVQEFVEERTRDLFRAAVVKIHAAGREDVDARMLGTGRPLVIEVVEPRIREIDMAKLNEVLRGKEIVVQVSSRASRLDIRQLKGESGKRGKAYRVLVLSSRPLGLDDLRKLESELANRAIRQRTPTRILRRKRDREVVKRVRSVKARAITPYLFEAIVHCDGGLYVKELVHCDGGRTSPCFGEVLGAAVAPLELDVLYVEGQRASEPSG